MAQWDYKTDLCEGSGLEGDRRTVDGLCPFCLRPISGESRLKPHRRRTRQQIATTFYERVQPNGEKRAGPVIARSRTEK